MGTRKKESDENTAAARKWIRTTVGIAADREQELIRRNNQSTFFHGMLIVLLPVLIVVGILNRNADVAALLIAAFSPALRRAPKRDVYIDVACVLAGVIGFQLIFYQFGKRWNYSHTTEMLATVADAYNEDGRPAANCAICMWDDATLAAMSAKAAAAAAAMGGTVNALQVAALGATSRAAAEAAGLPPAVASGLAGLNPQAIADEMGGQVRTALLDLTKAANGAVGSVTMHR